MKDSSIIFLCTSAMVTIMRVITGFGVDCKDIANMPFLKCFYGKVLAVWGVGGEVNDCKLALLEY